MSPGYGSELVRDDRAALGDAPMVSIVIPVFNDWERLEACLEALERQTYPVDRFEVLVVDNGSDSAVPDGTARYVNVTVLHEPKPGSYAARNRGLASAVGEVLAFTDSDCVPRADWLERGVARLRTTENPGFVGGKIELFFRNPRRPNAAEIYESVVAFPQEIEVTRGRRSVTANMMTLRSVLDEVGTFDDRLRSGGDLELTRRISDAGFEATYGDDVVVRHPARASLAELFRKQRRVARGQYELAVTVEGSGLGRVLRRYSTFVLAEGVRIARSCRTPSVHHKALAIVVNLLVRAVGLGEVTRLVVRDRLATLRSVRDLVSGEERR